jgi:sec-independent protein translocase protein TatB
MDFFGIGPLELLVIFILAFLFFGPEKLPGIAAKAGKWYRNFTRVTTDFSQTINREITKEIENENKQTNAVSSGQTAERVSPQISCPEPKSGEKPDEQ